MEVCGVVEWVASGGGGGGVGVGVGIKGFHVCNKDSHIEDATSGLSHKQNQEKTGHKNKNDYSGKGDACFKLTIYDYKLIKLILVG